MNPPSIEAKKHSLCSWKKEKTTKCSLLDNEGIRTVHKALVLNGVYNVATWQENKYIYTDKEALILLASWDSLAIVFSTQSSFGTENTDHWVRTLSIAGEYAVCFYIVVSMLQILLYVSYCQRSFIARCWYSQWLVLIIKCMYKQCILIIQYISDDFKKYSIIL